MKTRIKTIQNQKISEMSGYSDVGMHEESLTLAKIILSEEGLDAAAFKEALSAILIGGDGIESFKNTIQTAYGRLSKRDQQQVHREMIGYHHSIKDSQMALHFVPKNTNDPVHLTFGMEVSLENNRLDLAKKVCYQCRRALSEPVDSFTANLLLNALANYCARTGELDKAEKCWLQAAELDEPSLRNALSGLVEIQIVRAWKHLLHGLGQIEKFKSNISEATVFRLPGNHDGLLADAKKELETYREALEKIVSHDKLGRFRMGK